MAAPRPRRNGSRGLPARALGALACPAFASPPGRWRELPLLASSFVLGLACLASCKSEPPPAASEPPAGAVSEKKPVVDDKIANAMAAAQADVQAKEASRGGETAPPADGIMGMEAAAHELPPGSPASLVLGAEGASPRLRLGPERRPIGAGPAGKLQLSYRSGGSVMPTIDFDLKTKSSNSEGSAAAAGVPGAAGGASASAAPGGITTRFSLASARAAENQPGRLPENARAEIAKLNGSWVEVVTTSRGALLTQRFQLAGNNPDLQPVLLGSAETLASISLPYPEVPVGVGAFWMVKSRETANGAEVLAFRMVRLTELTPDKAQLTVNTRRYLVNPSLPLEGLPAHRVRQFESEGDATLNLRPGATYPETADLRDTFMALVTPSDRPNQAMPIQSETTAKLSFAQ
jgi:hypothetical protein